MFTLVKYFLHGCANDHTNSQMYVRTCDHHAVEDQVAGGGVGEEREDGNH